MRYILFHHQTTTTWQCVRLSFRCVISSFITKPQPIPTNLHQSGSCVISSFITKPQRTPRLSEGQFGCVISSFITKPQHYIMSEYARICCVISSFITKPQRDMETCFVTGVALYPLSSPNHNLFRTVFPLWLLRYILFHHQTTTICSCSSCSYLLRYILFHHQTTTVLFVVPASYLLRYILFHHQTTTVRLCYFYRSRLRYILFHHQTTTLVRWVICLRCCVISSFITKPQRCATIYISHYVALYPLSSPNHNQVYPFF